MVHTSPAIVLQAQVLHPTCPATFTGAIDLSIMGGAPPYQILWNTGSASQDLYGIASGTYSVLVTDAAGEMVSGQWDVIGPEPISAQAELSDHFDHAVSAPDAHDGSIALSISGGTPPYSIAWSNGTEGHVINALGVGDHAATITDANGCSATFSFQLDAAPMLTAPTGISPNGDGRNDVYIIQGIERYDRIELTVLDRQGAVVYRSNDYHNDWDGHGPGGSRLASGTYFTRLIVQEADLTVQGTLEIRY